MNASSSAGRQTGKVKAYEQPEMELPMAAENPEPYNPSV